MGITEDVNEVKTEQKGQILVIRLSGRLDALSAPQAERKIFAAIESGQEKLLLDLGRVTYLSSAGMRMLLSTSKKIRSLPGKLYLCNMTINVLDVLKMSGFDHVLELYQTEKDALQKF